MAQSSIVSEIKRDIGRKWRFFHTVPAFNAPFRGFASECCHKIWCRKCRMVWLFDDKKEFEDVFSSFDIIHHRDRRISVLVVLHKLAEFRLNNTN